MVDKKRTSYDLNRAGFAEYKERKSSEKLVNGMNSNLKPYDLNQSGFSGFD